MSFFSIGLSIGVIGWNVDMYIRRRAQERREDEMYRLKGLKR